ncbi:L,D-transpeptidase [bacterium]|nr:L,D-transpeptidase [bacterium]
MTVRLAIASAALLLAGCGIADSNQALDVAVVGEGSSDEIDANAEGEQPAAATATATANATPPSLPAGTATAARLGDIEYELGGCPEAERAAVADKASQRYWLCKNGVAVTDEIPMTTASGNYGLPPVGTYEVFARDRSTLGIGGEPLERFVAFYTTPRGNRIAFHEVVNQNPATVGDLDQRGASAGCFRVRKPNSVQIWEFLQLGDPVAVISN